jgi:hypothetical protein
MRQWCNGRFEDNHVVGNDSILGGGLHLTYDSSPHVLRNTIEANSAGSLGGGGLYIYFRSAPVVERNIVRHNISSNGAGMAVFYESAPIIRNNLLLKNVSGAGIMIKGGSQPVIIHNTILGSHNLDYTVGIDCTTNSVATIENNIIVDTCTYGITADETATLSVRYNNVFNNKAANYGPAITDLAGMEGNISSDPRFVDRDANNYSLRYDSPCINRAAPDFFEPGQYDLEGNVRRLGQFADMGAYEAYPVWNLTAGSMHVTIQQAIYDSNDGDAVVVTPGRYFENIDLSGRNISLSSVDPNNWNTVGNTIIDGNGLDTTVLAQSGEDANCMIAGFTITGGASVSGYGGGIRIRNYSGPTIRNNIVEGNAALKGAGINLYHAFSQVINNRIYNNRTFEYGQGGGVMLIDCLEDVNVVLANNVIAGNSALYGGGIRIEKSQAEIVNNVIAFNRATWKGIGIYAEEDTIRNCIVWGHGGGSEQDLYRCTAEYSSVESAVAGAGNIYSDPCFVHAGYWDENGTPADFNDDFFVLGNYHIKPTSQCIDGGDSNSLPPALTVDMDEEERIYGGSVDIGADELVANDADLNEDGLVDCGDVMLMALEWLLQHEMLESDLYNDGLIDLRDYCMLAGQWKWRAGWRY